MPGRRLLHAILVVAIALAAAAAAAAAAPPAFGQDPPVRLGPSEELDLAAEEEEREEEEEDDDDGRKFFSIGVRGGIWVPSIEGEIESQEAGEIDLEDDLDLDEMDPVPFGEAFITLKYVALYVSYFAIELEGTTTLSDEIELGGVVFEVDEKVRSKLDFQTAAALLQVNPLAIDVAELGIVVGARWLDMELDVESKTLDEEQDEELQLFVPLVGASLTFFITDYFEVGARAAGIYIDYLDYEGLYFEAEAFVGFNIIDQIGVGVSWMAYYIDLEKNENGDSLQHQGDALIMGPMAYIRLRL